MKAEIKIPLTECEHSNSDQPECWCYELKDGNQVHGHLYQDTRWQWSYVVYKTNKWGHRMSPTHSRERWGPWARSRTVTRMEAMMWSVEPCKSRWDTRPWSR